MARIDQRQVVAGAPALAVRALLRDMRRWSTRGGYFQDLNPRPLRVVLEATPPDDGTVGTRSHLNAVIERLAAEGLIEPVELDSYDRPWRTTIKGNALCNASAAKPITRATAVKALQALIARTKDINADSAYAFRVQQLMVFGSYLDPSVERLGDIDVAYVLVPRTTDAEKQSQLSQKRIDEAIASGRRFSSFFEQVVWPQQEVLLVLRSRSRVISLHEVDPQARLTDRVETVYRMEPASGDAPP